MVPAKLTDPLLSGQVMAIFVITIAAAEVGVALAVVLLLFRVRATSDLTEVEELGEASATYTENPAGPVGDPYHDLTGVEIVEVVEIEIAEAESVQSAESGAQT